jgi:ribosome recycling factor
MLDQLKNETKSKMDKACEALSKELMKIRTGKANPSMLDSVKVNYYGQPSPLSQVAAISCPDAKSFLIAPWEPSILKEIETAIVKSDLGMTPMSDGKVVRLKVPDLTEQRRKDLVKQTKKIVEDSKVIVRNHRRDANELLKKALKDKTISEDQMKRIEAEIQKVTDASIALTDKIAADKEKDIMTI